MDQKLQNMQTAIGCNKKQFEQIIQKAVGNITMSSGSWYSPYWLFDSQGTLAKYESDGTLIFSR